MTLANTTEHEHRSSHSHSNWTAEDVSAFELNHILLPSMIYVVILMTVGVIGNTLVCYIFHKKWKKRKKPSTLFIISLSAIDLINCLSTLPFDLILLMNFFSFDYPVLCKVSRWMTYALNCASSVVLIGIATDRLIGIRYSFTRKPFGIFRAKCIIISSFFVAMVTCWPAYVLYGTRTDIYKHSIQTRSCSIDDDFINTKYIRWFVFYLLTSNIMCDSILVAMYSLIGLTIFQQNRRKAEFEMSIMYDTRRRESSLSLASVEADRLRANLKVPKFIVTTAAANVIVCECPDKDQHDEKCCLTKQIDTQLEVCLKKDCAVRCLPLDTKINTNSNTLSEPSPPAGSSNALINQKRLYSSRAVIFAGDGKKFGPSIHTKKTTFMLFIVTLVYILTFVPYCTIAIMRTLKGNTFYLDASTLSQNFYQLFLRSYMLSMATNPIIYCFLNKYFRKECFVIIKRGVLCFIRKY